MCIIPGLRVLLLFMISPFSAIVADVSAQFATSQLSDIIVLPRIKWGHFLRHQIVISMRNHEEHIRR